MSTLPVPIKNRATGVYGDKTNAGYGNNARAALDREAEQAAAKAAEQVAANDSSDEEGKEDKRNFLRKPQRAMLRKYIKENASKIVGLKTQDVADAFNAEVAAGNPIFDRQASCHNVKNLLDEFGMAVLRYKIVVTGTVSDATEVEAQRPQEPGQPKEKESEATLAVAPVAVTLYRAADGTLHETLEEALMAEQSEEFGKFIHEWCALDPFDAKQLAVSILKHHTVTKKV